MAGYFTKLYYPCVFGGAEPVVPKYIRPMESIPLESIAKKAPRWGLGKWLAGAARAASRRGCTGRYNHALQMHTMAAAAIIHCNTLRNSVGLIFFAKGKAHRVPNTVAGRP